VERFSRNESESPPRRWWRPTVLLLAAALGCVPAELIPDTADPGITRVRLPDTWGALDRPAATFDHQRHVDALTDEDCERCHEGDEEDTFDPWFDHLAPGEDPSALVDRIHDRCMSCHAERDEGTLVCGECHVDRPAGPPRVAVVFDASLHQRHVDATEEACETCHHQWDEEQQKLVYVEGAQGACTDCHGDTVVEDRPTLRDASHIHCVGCHHERDDRGDKAGPLTCSGCHDPVAIAQIEPLDEIPRLENEQPDVALIHAEGAESKEVTFDHLAHETRAPFCTTCHHRTAKACSECHTLLGSEDGDGVKLETAHHDAASERSCVGCHRREALEPDCAGCHAALPKPPSESSCDVCHTGDLGESPVEVALPPLPPTSDEEFPEVVVIDLLSEDYEPSEMPHAKIVKHLDDLVRKSELASAFHEATEVVCAGCHHHSPVGERPPGCESCHDLESNPIEDRPGLKAAFHRQCLGCHEQMGLEKVGCTDCHDEAEQEEAP